MGTVGQLVSPMIDDASDTYERLYQVKVGESVNIVFKFTTSEERTEGVSEDIMGGKEVATSTSEERTEGVSEDIKGGKEVARAQEDEKISVLCQHEHPYLDKNVWLATKGRMDSTILKGNVLLLSVTLLQKCIASSTVVDVHSFSDIHKRKPCCQRIKGRK